MGGRATTGDSAGATAGTTKGTTGATAAGTGGDDPANHHVTDEGTPVRGGNLVYGLDSDTANAWAP